MKKTLLNRKLNTIQLLLVWLILVISISIIIGRINWFKYYNLAEYGIQTRGTVTNKESYNHESIYYTYIVDHKNFTGIGHDGNGNPKFDDLKIGDRVIVFFLPNNNQISCIGNPKDLLQNETISILLASLIIPTLVILSFSKRKI